MTKQNLNHNHSHSKMFSCYPDNESSRLRGITEHAAFERDVEFHFAPANVRKRERVDAEYSVRVLLLVACISASVILFNFV